MRHVSRAVTVVGVVGGAALVVFGLWGVNQNPDRLWHIVAGGVILGAAAFGYILSGLALKIEAHAARSYSAIHDLSAMLERFDEIMARIERNTALSDSARSIAFRAREWQAIREAVLDEINKEDFESVFRLIDRIEERQVYQDEVQQLRAETQERCTDAFRQKLAAAIEHISGLLGARKWDQAKSEIERIERLMPNEPRIRELYQALEKQRNEYKQTLLRQWNEAVNAGRVEKGIEILRTLDQYLTAEEARSAESLARELFRERLQQLGIQFQFAVKEKRWRDALATGIQIMEEFPNARMSSEIKDRLDALRARAGFSGDVPVIARDQESPEKG